MRTLPAALLLACMIPGIPTSGAAETVVLFPVADAKVTAQSPSENFGNATSLEVVRESAGTPSYVFLRFDLTGLPAGAQISAASLSMTAFTGYAWGGDGIVYVHDVTDDSWAETGITWNSRPAHGSVLGNWWLWYNGNVFDQVGTTSDAALAAAAQVAADGDGQLSLMLRSPGFDTSYRSREYGNVAQRPQLQLDFPTTCPDMDADGYDACGADCDDTRADVHPGAPELLDGVDNDCDGTVDEGFEYPMIRSIADVPGDQGRAVRLRWRGHAYDAPGSPQSVMSYSVFRQVQPGQAPAGAARLQLEAAALALPPGEWDLLTTLAAYADTAYQTVLPTLCDSNATSYCRSTFVVRAHFQSPGSFVDSPPDSGWSVDNLVPGPPSGLLVNLVANAAELSWGASPEPDFQYYRIYRGASADFEPSSGNLVHTTAATTWSDPSPGSGAVHYKVTTVDANGNESSPAESGITVDVATGTRPAVLALAGVTPNPFSAAASVRFELPEASRVRLTIHDLAGRRVRTLANGFLPPGRFDRSWDARDDQGRPMPAGIYVVKLEADGTALTRRVALLR